jgi:hypothetical protein
MSAPAVGVVGCVAGLIGAALACAAEPRAIDQPDPAVHTTLLTASAPRVDLAITAFASPPDNLALTIAAIDNPSAIAFSVAVRVAWRGDGAPIDAALGSVTPFPATRPGTFLISIGEPARTLLVRKDGRLTARVELQPVAADRPLAEPLRVSLGELRWR